jgi:hypothetical protein
MMLGLLIAYYTNRAVFSALNQLADYKRFHGLVFVIARSITAGALASTTATNLTGLRGQQFPQRLNANFFDRSGIHAVDYLRRRSNSSIRHRPLVVRFT